MILKWLPITRDEMIQRGWNEVDVVLVTGDAYVDHPAFGVAVIGRVLEQEGLRVAIIPQPNWQDDLRDFKKFGAPRLFFGVTSGNMDSMVNHYTAARRLRSDDAFTPDGRAGFRPDYAVTVYSKILKRLYPDVPVVLGGIEASLRRLTHYDFWSDRLRPSVLIESGADLLVYGMGEKTIREIVRLMRRGVPFSSLKTLPQTAFVQPASDSLPKNKLWQDLVLPSHETCVGDSRKFAEAFHGVEVESNRTDGQRLSQPVGDRTVVVNPAEEVWTDEELDASYDLPYTRLPHPKYRKRGEIPAHRMIKFSVTIHRGCFGGCSFCTLSAHQGRTIVSRSKRSILQEVEAIKEMEGFQGYLSDLGGPSANMYGMRGKDPEQCLRCRAVSCIHPQICRNLDTNPAALLDLYRAVRAVPGIKKVIISSGIRHDLCLAHPDYIRELVRHHVSGRLKVAPEHTEDSVLRRMRKPSFDKFIEFKRVFDEYSRQSGLHQDLLPYFISGHPGTSDQDMARLADKVEKLVYRLEQVQEFTPTPMTVSSVVYHSGVDPSTKEAVVSPKTARAQRRQKEYFFWHKKYEHSRGSRKGKIYSSKHYAHSKGGHHHETPHRVLPSQSKKFQSRHPRHVRRGAPKEK
ncbi:MAG TPA: YgiQ family radical SAM protein [Elusimicrobiota bacterium]|nr:YgiQ family radical SAM protein [Elusimicrobiota bacterium]